MKTTGRKPSYTAEALEAAIERADAERADGDPATTAEVKRALIAATGIHGVNDASLRDHIEDVRAARKKRHEDKLIAALPQTTIGTIDEALEQERRALQVAAGAAYAALCDQHAEELATVQREKRSMAIALQDAHDALDATRAELDTVRAEREAARTRIAELDEELATERRAASEAAAAHAATRRALDTLTEALRASGHVLQTEDTQEPPHVGQSS